MTDFFKDIIGNLYTKHNVRWINAIDDNEISPMKIQRYLLMHKGTMHIAKWLDKYTFSLPPKIYLALAWSVLPKYEQSPFITYIHAPDKKERLAKLYETPDGYAEIWERVRNVLELSDNDFISAKPFLVDTIEKDKVTWMKRLGMDKSVWTKHGLDTNEMSSGGQLRGKMGLDMWGLGL